MDGNGLLHRLRSGSLKWTASKAGLSCCDSEETSQLSLPMTLAGGSPRRLTRSLHNEPERLIREVFFLRHAPAATKSFKEDKRAALSDQGSEDVDDRRSCWSSGWWSPPPESNRRPHPYHGTTRNRCANPRFPRSPPTVRPKLSVLLRRSYALTLRACTDLSLEPAIISGHRLGTQPVVAWIISRFPGGNSEHRSAPPSGTAMSLPWCQLG